MDQLWKNPYTWDNNLFVDLDGVCVDFERGFENAFGIRHDSVPEPLMWKMITERERHWHDLPAMPGAIKLWTNIVGLNPTILTGCPRREAFKPADQGKRSWCEREFGTEIPVITCLSVEKPEHIKNRGDILIDDMQKNITRWEQAGGRGILFQNTEQALAKLNALIHQDKKNGTFRLV